MSYIGAEPTTAAFPFDQFSGNGSTTAFTLTYAPAGPTSIIVAISGVVQNPNNYSVIGTTLSFSPAPPTGSNNISVLYLGLPVIGTSSPGNTAFLSSTDLTATSGQTVFASAGAYTPGFVQVFRNGARLGNADFTATNGTTITLARAATAGDLVTIEYYTLTSLVNALPITGGTVTGSTTFNSAVTINGAAVSGYTGTKNFIINGSIGVWQRGTSFAASTSTAGGFYADRFWLYGANAGSGTFDRSTDVPDGQGFAYSFANNTSGTFACGTNVELSIQGSHAPFVYGGTYTLSFWIKATSAATATVASQYENAHADGTNRVTIATSSFSVGTTWNKVTWSFAINQNPYSTSKVLGIEFSGLGPGFKITGIQLERGSNATSFEYIDYGRQLSQCQRYYEVVSSGEIVEAGNYYSGWRYLNPIRFSVTKRAIPTVVVTLQTGWPNGSGGTYGLDVSTQYVGIQAQTGNALTNQLHNYNFTVSAEL